MAIHDDMGFSKGWTTVHPALIQFETHKQWIEESLSGKWDVWANTWYFETEQEATLFAMVWA